MDEQKVLLQGVWRKAWGQEEALEIPCKTASGATRLRFALYNAVRDVRSGKSKADESLLQATENCSIGYLPGDKTTLLIQRKVLTDLMQTLTGIVGNAPGALKSEEDMEIEASQALVMQKLSGASPSEIGDAGLGLPRKTPYYER